MLALHLSDPVLPQLGPRTEKRETFTRLPGHLNTKDAHTMPSSPKPLTPEQIRELEKKAAEAEKAEREAIERGMEWVAAPREVRTEQEQAEHEAAWFDATLDAAGFFAMENITPVQAAMLLCRFSPHDETLRDAETSTTDETTPDDFKRLLATFDERAAARPGARSLLDWMAVAAGAGRKTHSWAVRYAKHHGMLGPPEPEASPAPAAPPSEPEPQATRVKPEPAWIDEARRVAKAYITDRKGRDLYPTLLHVAQHVAEVLRGRKVYGPSGKPLSAAYIKRHALGPVKNSTGNGESTRAGQGKRGKP